MKVTINGKEYSFDKEYTISTLLNKFNLEPEKIAVEQNLNIIQASDYDKIMVSNNDRIELVQFIGGG